MQEQRVPRGRLFCLRKSAGDQRPSIGLASSTSCPALLIGSAVSLTAWGTGKESMGSAPSTWCLCAHRERGREIWPMFHIPMFIIYHIHIAYDLIKTCGKAWNAFVPLSAGMLPGACAVMGLLRSQSCFPPGSEHCCTHAGSASRSKVAALPLSCPH